MAKQITDARQAPFVWFDVTLDDAGLSPYAFRLYCRIARRTTGGKTHFFEALTNAALACKMSERQARYAIKLLLQCRMIRCVQKSPGLPTIYALTDKSEWLPVPPARGADVSDPLHQMQETPAPNADPPAPNAGVPLHHVPTKKTHGRKNPKKKPEAEAARTRANGNSAAASRFTETEILDYLEATKPDNAARNSGLAHKLYLTAEDDHLIERWLHKQAAHARTGQRHQQHQQQQKITSAAQLAQELLLQPQVEEYQKPWLPDLITTLSTAPEHSALAEQLKGLQ